MNINSKHPVWRKPGTAHHMQSTIPKIKCAGSSLMLWGCFSAAGTEGHIRSRRKAQSTKILRYWWTMDLNTQQEWLIDNLWMSLSGPARARAWTQSNISGETWKCVSAPIQPDRAWEVKRWGEEWQIQVHLNKLECREKFIFSCNLFQKVKLSYILDSLHVK